MNIFLQKAFSRGLFSQNIQLFLAETKFNLLNGSQEALPHM